MIQLVSLYKDFENNGVTTKVLRGVNMKVEKGEFVSIMGPSGSGKSTLMHILGFLDRPTAGKYFFLGKDTEEFHSDQLAQVRNEAFGFVFQSFFLLSKTNIIENVRLPLYYSKKNRSEYDERVKKAIESVGLSHRMYHISEQLSGGEKQRVAIARALVTDPKAILADEPTGNLDSVSGAQVLTIFEKLHKEGKTIILVTHDIAIAKRAKRIIYVKDGNIESDQLL